MAIENFNSGKTAHGNDQSLRDGIVSAVHRSPTHTLAKTSQDRIRLLTGLGVEDDAHLGKTVQHLSRIAKDANQPNLRQVHLIHAEIHDALRAIGFDISAGQMGENITTRGIDLLGLPTGTRLHIGESAIVEIKGHRNPCHQLDTIQKGLMAATLDRDAGNNLIRKAGVMGIIVAEGNVEPLNPVRVELPPEPHNSLGPV